MTNTAKLSKNKSAAGGKTNTDLLKALISDLDLESAKLAARHRLHVQKQPRFRCKKEIIRAVLHLNLAVNH